MSKKIKLFTHNDLDGVGCYILLKKHTECDIGVEYCNYDNINTRVKKFLSNDISEYESIIITDISVDEEVAELLDKLEDKPFLLDHHKTAEWLNKYDWACVQTIDSDIKEETCATYMLCKYLYAGRQEEHVNEFRFANAVRLYDTWLWFSKYDDQEPKMLNDLMKIHGRDTFIKRMIEAIEEGILLTYSDIMLLQIEKGRIKRYIRDKSNNMKTIDIQGYKAGIVFAESNISELGNEMCRVNDKIDFAVVINMMGTISYRTIKDNIDVSKIAEMYGGGGHKMASGSRIHKGVINNLVEELFHYGKKV